MYFLALIIVQNFEKKSSELIQNNEDLLRKSMDWFLYDNGLRHERVKISFAWNWFKMKVLSLAISFWKN